MPLASDVDKAKLRYERVPPSGTTSRRVDVPGNTTRRDKGFAWSRQKPRFEALSRTRTPVPRDKIGDYLKTSESRRLARQGTVSLLSSPTPELDRGEGFTPLWTAGMGSKNRPAPFTATELERRRMSKKGDWPHKEQPRIRLVYDEELEGPEYMHHAARPSSSSSSFCKGRRTTPVSWNPTDMSSPGPVYVPGEASHRVGLRCLSPEEQAKRRSVAMMERRPRSRAAIGHEQRFAPGVRDYVTQTAPNESPGPFRYRPEDADGLALPGRPTAATVGAPRREPGAMNYAQSRSRVPGPKYRNLDLDSMSVHSGFSREVATTFGKAVRDMPRTRDYAFMSAPPTSGDQVWPYQPMSPKSLGSHTHNHFGGASAAW